MWGVNTLILLFFVAKVKSTCTWCYDNEVCGKFTVLFNDWAVPGTVFL